MNSSTLKLRHGTAAQTAVFVGSDRELTIVDDDHTLRVHDGATPGGHVVTGGPGDKGPDGDQGPDGDKGPVGDKGIQGDPGPVGSKGPNGDKGATGDTGGPGTTGAPGSKWFEGTVAPTAAIGVDGDLFLMSTGDVYTRASGAWTLQFNIRGPQGQIGSPGSPGAAGAKGDTGAPGAMGPAGASGGGLLSGHGAPASSLGVATNFYLDLTADVLYGPKTSDTVWPTTTIALGGGGGGTTVIFANPRTLYKPRRRVVADGDSITQGNSFANPNGLYEMSSTGYAEQSIFKTTGNRYTIVANLGIGGQTTTQIRARFPATLALKPDILMLMGGTNDMATTGQMSDIAVCMNNIEYMIVKALDAGILPIVVTPPVKSNNNPGFDVVRASIPFYYRLAEFYGVPLIDMFKVTADPATGNYITGYSADGIHPQGAGLTAMSNWAAKALNDLYAYSAGPYLAAVSETAVGKSSNLLANGSFALQATAGIPDSWGPNLAGATGSSTAAVLPYTGKTFKYTKTDASQAYALFGPAVPAGTYFKTGDRLVLSGEVSATGLATGAAGFTVGADFAGSVTIGGVPTPIGDARPVNQFTLDGVYAFSQEILIPAGVTLGTGDITVSLFTQDKAAYTVNNWTLTNHTAMDVIFKAGVQSIPSDVPAGGGGSAGNTTDFSDYIEGKFTPAETVYRYVTPRGFKIAAGGAPSIAVAPAASPATATAVFTLMKNGVSFGTMRFAAGATLATFTIAAAVTFVAGDVLSIVSPTLADATLADVSFTMSGTLT